MSPLMWILIGLGVVVIVVVIARQKKATPTLYVQSGAMGMRHSFIDDTGVYEILAADKNSESEVTINMKAQDGRGYDRTFMRSSIHPLNVEEALCGKKITWTGVKSDGPTGATGIGLAAGVGRITAHQERAIAEAQKQASENQRKAMYAEEHGWRNWLEQIETILRGRGQQPGGFQQPPRSGT